MGRNENRKSSSNRSSATATVHPYTFIPLQSRRKVVPTADVELLSGVVRCGLTAKTEIAVPDMQLDDGSFPFFRVDGVPTIPGSAIRGVVRSVYETLTDSCVRTNEGHFHARSSQSKEAGLLAWDGKNYYLYPAERYRIVDTCDTSKYSIGEEVAFEASASKGNSSNWATPGKGGRKGFFLEVNRFETRKNGKTIRSHASIFEKKPNEERQLVDDLSIQCFKENIDLYDLETGADGKGAQKKVGRLYKEAFLQVKNNGLVLPVWYEKTDDGFRFAPSQLSRSVFAIGPLGFIEAVGLAPCKTAEDCCPACELFGFVSDGAARPSKVRFGDARCVNGAESEWVSLSALMEPKMSSFEFYLRNDRVTHSFNPDDSDTVLSGRKMYWHSQKGLKGASQLSCRDDLGGTYEAIKPGARFGFSIFFDEVTPDQLNNLLFALNMGEIWSGDDSYCVKVGHGKPLGLGSAHISVEEVFLRKYENSEYGVESGFDCRQPEACVARRLSHVDTLKAVMNFGAVPSEKVIAYPSINGDGLAWYQKNRKVSSEKRSYKEVLEVDGRYGYRAEDVSAHNVQSFGEKKKSGEVDSRWAALLKLKS